MQCLRLNDECMLGSHDEFASFNDNLDKGSSGNSERARYVSLYSATSWSKKTKTSGSFTTLAARARWGMQSG